MQRWDMDGFTVTREPDGTFHIDGLDRLRPGWYDVGLDYDPATGPALSVHWRAPLLESHTGRVYAIVRGPSVTTYVTYWDVTPRPLWPNPPVRLASRD